MGFQSNSAVKGTVNLVLRGPQGKVKQHKTIRNKVMRTGLAHIVGRMIDPKQNGNAVRLAGSDIIGADTGSLQAVGAYTDSYGILDQHDLPPMMRYMGIGTGPQPNIGIVATGTDTQIKDGKLTTESIEGLEYRLQNEVTIKGTAQDYYNATVTNNTLADPGRCDMACLKPNAAWGIGGSTLIDITETINAAPVTLDRNSLVPKSPVTNLFQGKLVSNTLTPDRGRAEGISGEVTLPSNVTLNDAAYTGGSDGVATSHRNDINGVATGHTDNIYNNYKRMGSKLVYIGFFPPNCPSAANTPTAITEAGIFNNQNSLAIGGAYSNASAMLQTMLCRTTFAPVNKYKDDSLQITWTIDFADATN